MLELISAARRRRRPPTHEMFDVVSQDFRVGLLDIDINLHLNNGKYVKIMDRCRLEHGVVTGLLDRMIKARTHTIVANTEIAYIRELRPYQRFQVHTRILGWDDKYTYYDQRFESQRKLHTHALLRLAHLYGGKPISPQAFQEMTGLNRRSPVLPDYVQDWKNLLQSKRRLTEQDDSPLALGSR
ncbi:thioesterase family protein [Alloalcanivorax xenomutans]|uniref:Thioesterase family protein n=1 Tax=Alloalcanivorax xenomutans TaxID=1094342 RepID=A0A9Q3ZDQ9_9GAMM|nr:thioesterase family protein [Alloalcanivorax xenomutans]MCE7510028.1 thioesterase family protein [Alloalcanivorax xenomutans]MCE7522580.1 thioesterase family protein [Alloalcanivorax xenomutans]